MDKKFPTPRIELMCRPDPQETDKSVEDRWDFSVTLEGLASWILILKFAN
jgi:hypothetical protein